MDHQSSTASAPETRRGRGSDRHKRHLAMRPGCVRWVVFLTQNTGLTLKGLALFLATYQMKVAILPDRFPRPVICPHRIGDVGSTNACPQSFSCRPKWGRGG